MRLEPWYRATFTTPESWAVQLPGPGGGEGQSFLIAEGRCFGVVSGRLRAANYPRRRSDGVLLPDFRGAIETDDGATVLFSWNGCTRTGSGGARELVGAITHLSDDHRYQWLNQELGVLTGEVRPRDDGQGFDVVLDIARLVWEPGMADGVSGAELLPK